MSEYCGYFAAFLLVMMVLNGLQLYFHNRALIKNAREQLGIVKEGTK